MNHRAQTHLTAAQTHLTAAQTHLTEDELDELLIADGSPDEGLTLTRREHLAACPECQARCEEFGTTLAHFNQASLAWSEARSNTLNRELTRELTEAAARKPGWPVPNAVLATVSAALLAAAGVMMTSSSPLHFAPQPKAAATTRFSVAANQRAAMDQAAADASATDNIATDNIATDNAMLHAIDSVLSTPEPSPLELYRTSESNAATHHAPASQGVNE